MEVEHSKYNFKLDTLRIRAPGHMQLYLPVSGKGLL